MFVLVVRNNSNPQAQEASLVLGSYLGMQGIDHALVLSSDLTGPAEVGEVRRVIEQGVDLVVVLGGDGTILRTARQVGTLGVPILGINFGRLGFLANASDDGVVAIVAAALAGEVVAERRANLRIDVVCEGERDPWGDDEDAGEDARKGAAPEAPRTFFALNELAVTRGANGRLIDFSLGVSGASVADMRGDGVVVATATGSTGYALSAGGPLISPGYDGLVVVPIAPHTLHSRSIVTGENDVVEVTLAASPEGSYPRDASLFVDGELLEFPTPVRHVYVRRGEHPTVLLRYQREGFYEHISKTFF